MYAASPACCTVYSIFRIYAIDSDANQTMLLYVPRNLADQLGELASRLIESDFHFVKERMICDTSGLKLLTRFPAWVRPAPDSGLTVSSSELSIGLPSSAGSGAKSRLWSEINVVFYSPFMLGSSRIRAQKGCNVPVQAYRTPPKSFESKEVP
jgi:hypothetical protein